MGFFDFFKPKKEKAPAPEILETPQQNIARTSLGEYAKRFGGETLVARGAPYRPYEGELVAGLTPTEQTGQDILSQFSVADEPSLFGLSRGELEKTIQGGFDPLTSPYYQATRDLLGRESEDQIEALRRSQQLRGAFRSTGGLREEGRLREGLQSRIGQVIGELALQERERQFKALPLAQVFAQTQEQAPIRRLQAIQQYGGLPRQIEQAGLGAGYQEFQRQLGGEQDMTRLLLDILNSQSAFYQPSYTTSIGPGQAAYSMINPFYGDILRSQGANAPGLSTGDVLSLVAMM